MNDDNNDDNPSHIAVKQVPVYNADDELKKDYTARNTDNSSGEDSVLGGDSPADDFGDIDPDDPDAGGVMKIDEALSAVGLEGDDGEHPHELGEDRLNTNALDDVSTPRTDDEEELDKAA